MSLNRSSYSLKLYVLDFLLACPCFCCVFSLKCHSSYAALSYLSLVVIISSSEPHSGGIFYVSFMAQHSLCHIFQLFVYMPFSLLLDHNIVEQVYLVDLCLTSRL